MSAFTFVRGFSIFPFVHSGIDLSASRGTPVHAVAGGPVKYAGSADAPGAPANTRGAGNVVVIVVGPLEHHYAHLDTIRAAGSVYAGGLIGGVGMTGKATGYHLHFGIWDTRLRRYVDPLGYISLANLIRALSGSGGTGGTGVVPVSNVTTVAITTSVLTEWLTRINRKLTDPVRAEDVIPFVQFLQGKRIVPGGDPGNPLVSAVITVMQRTVGLPWAAVAGTFQAASVQPQDPFGLGAAVAGLGQALTHIGQGAVLAGLAFLGVWLLVKGR